MQGKGQYDINELFHYSGKDKTKKWFCQIFRR